MGIFDDTKKVLELQKKAKQIKAKLGSLHIEAEGTGLKIVINGEQEVMKVEITDPAMLQAGSQKALEEALVKTFNKAIKKSQEVAANEMKELMGGMGLPGLGA